MINLITISAPSGSGKTTLCKALQKVIPEIEWSTSYTTREQRSIEFDGVDYHFISHNEFEDLILKQDLAEWENVHGY
ncbi:MAG TPA: guanylate kinase, partial [Candidatus Marinimicrobia bacterium]|nr:guanylate kinase [Candidatus Neomarinimicrobiota bacterium]